MTRQLWVVVHRVCGLAGAAFLIVVGATGSLLAFLPELNRLATPEFFTAQRAGPLLGPGTLATQVQERLPGVRIRGVFLHEQGTAIVGVSPAGVPSSGLAQPPTFDQLFLDPYTGKELGRRLYGAIADGRVNLMPFIYRLHYNLSLGRTGAWILGIAAVVWTLDCLVGLYLTLPVTPHQSGTVADAVAGPKQRRFLRRWLPAWQVKRRASTYRRNFDLHRAGGLWLWLALLVFGWSSVHMNMHDWVYAPVTRLLLDYPAQAHELPPRAGLSDHPRLDWRAAQATGERLMAEQASARGFIVLQTVALWIDRQHNTYRYVVRSTLDFQDRRGRTWVSFDADSGALQQMHLPSGQHSGSTVTNWLVSLHEANVFGLPYKVFVSALGAAIVMLSVTGFYLWARKRRARGKAADRRSIRSRKPELR